MVFLQSPKPAWEVISPSDACWKRPSLSIEKGAKKNVDFESKIFIVVYATNVSVEKFIFSVKPVSIMKTSKTNAFTLIELLVVISIIAILAGIALPAFTTVQIKGRQTQALSNVKQIVLACRLFASDNNGNYPTNQLDPATLQPSTTLGPITQAMGSNAAFAQLFPDYLQNETIFCEAGSAFTPTGTADNKIDVPQQATPVNTLIKGENTFAYILGLTDTSNSLLPLVADGFNAVGNWTYSNVKSAAGGVWEGKKAVVGLVDGSATVSKVIQSGALAMTVGNNPVAPAASYFSNNTGAAAAGQQWLGVTNIALNPLGP
jgi:prepilin-type N-terminal cleavage/methylation domain-containing protein